jgi:hypothetical protein
LKTNVQTPLLLLLMFAAGASIGAVSTKQPDVVLFPLVDGAGVGHWLNPYRVEEVIEYESGVPKPGGQQSLVRMANGAGTLYPVPPATVVEAVEAAWTNRYSEINAEPTDR